MRQPESLRLVPGTDTVGAALAWLESVARRERWPERAAFRLQLCLDEALTNVVSHGFPGPLSPDAEIDLQVCAGDGMITLDIVDNGVAFDPTRIEPAPLAQTLDAARMGGHGLRLMHHYLRDLSYAREDGRNRLRLVLEAGEAC